LNEWPIERRMRELGGGTALPPGTPMPPPPPR